jgi:arginase
MDSPPIRKACLIGVPFDGYGRVGHQAAAAGVLREEGLAEVIGRHHDLVHSEDVALPAGDSARGPETSLVNEPALLAMTERLGARVAQAVEVGHLPFVFGADCSTLLGTIPALRQTGPVGLVFVDGHEDTMPLDVSEDGEAANAEIGLLLGLTGRNLPDRLARRWSALDRGDLAVVGVRDAAWRRRFNVGSLRDAGVWLRDGREAAAAPEATGGAAVGHLLTGPGRWWLHVDLDVLDPEVFPAQGVPGAEHEPDGLTWDQLTGVLAGAVDRGGCLGMSVAIYDPDQDSDRSGARRVVQLVDDVLAGSAG